MSINENRMQASTIKKSFIEKWSLQKINTLTIEEYVSNGDRSGFCYELEFGTPGIGSIRGGNSIKFGLYKRKNSQDEIKLKNVNSNEQYTWQSQLGSDAKSAFESIKKGLIDLIAAAQTGTLEAINKVDLPFMWNVVKWKLAFMYAPEGTLVDIFSSKWLLSYSGETTLLAAYKNIMKKYDKNQYDSIWDFSLKVWEEINKKQGSEAAVIDEVPIDPEDTDPSNPRDKAMTMQHNTILFGPPGTGKTYNTINHALLALHEDVSMLSRDQQLEKFNEYVSKGQILFTTFHQSYGYEEFIEGIKPDMEFDDGEVRYEVKDGVFKELCNRALGVKTFKSGKDEIEIKSDATVWKVSLGSSGNNPIKTKCFDEGTIRIGWTSVKEVGDEYYIKLGSKNKNTIRNFIDEMKIGDIVVSIGNQKNADAIGVIVGDYQTDNDPNYPKFRNVKWYFTGRNVSIYDLNERKNLVQQTVYKLHSISVEKVISLLKEQGVFNTPTSPEDYESKINYVIIIDEINRGNISKIFGELITLIEPSKRIGAPEELRVALPYSGNEFDGGKGFGVPSNVYIIGTMNTADRSIALMDTALRRRFEFIEMMPNYETLSDIVVDGIYLKKLLEVINCRISYLYDRDHQIGHAYFIGVNTKDKLDSVFRNKIIPLLQEYFYDDWEKIQIVLGDHDMQKPDNKDRFVISQKLKEVDVLGFNHDDIVDETVTYTISENFTSNAYLKITAGFSCVIKAQGTDIAKDEQV